MKIKSLSKLARHEIHDHHVVILIFIIVIGFTYANVNHSMTHNCHILEPTIICDQKGTIDRNTVQNNPQFVFIPASISLYHLDEFRQKPEFGVMHVECQPHVNNCTYHYDTFTGVVGFGNIFSNIAHLGDNVSTSCIGATVVVGNDCFGLPDYMAVLLIWAVIIFGGYYIPKHIILYIAKHL